MTEQEYKQHKKKENSLYFWLNAIEFLSEFANAALMGSSITLVIIGGHNWLPPLLILLAISIRLLGHKISKILENKWEYEFSICAKYMGDKLMERIKDETDRENKKTTIIKSNEKNP